jgi:hypothetical protein
VVCSPAMSVETIHLIRRQAAVFHPPVVAGLCGDLGYFGRLWSALPTGDFRFKLSQQRDDLRRRGFPCRHGAKQYATRPCGCEI